DQITDGQLQEVAIAQVEIGEGTTKRRVPIRERQLCFNGDDATGAARQLRGEIAQACADIQHFGLCVQFAKLGDGCGGLLMTEEVLAAALDGANAQLAQELAHGGKLKLRVAHRTPRAARLRRTMSSAWRRADSMLAWLAIPRPAMP